MKKKLLFVCVVLGVLVFGGVFFFLKWDSELIDVNSSLVQELYEMVIPNEIGYVQRKFYVQGITNEYKINLGISHLVKDGNHQGNLLASDVEKSVKEVLGKNVSLEHQSIYYHINGFCGYEYHETEKYYEPFDGCGQEDYESFYKKILRAEKTGSRIILTEQLIYLVINHDLISNMYVYNNPQKEKILYSVLDYDFQNLDVVEREREKSKEYLDQGSIYQFTFIEEDGHYIFEKIEKIS